MSRFGCGRELPVPGVTRELDKPEYANLGPGHYKSRDIWIKKGNGLCFGSPHEDRFAPSSCMVVPETAKMRHLGPGQYNTQGIEMGVQDPVAKALQPSYEFGGNNPRFHGLWRDASDSCPMLDPAALTKDNWIHGPVILEPGVVRKSDKAPFMNRSYKGPPTPPKLESPPASPSAFTVGPCSPRQLLAQSVGERRGGTNLLVPKTARPASSTRKARGAKSSYASLQAGLERKRSTRGMTSDSGAKWCSARPSGEARLRPQSAATKRGGGASPMSEARARAQVAKRPQSARIGR